MESWSGPPAKWLLCSHPPALPFNTEPQDVGQESQQGSACARSTHRPRMTSTFIEEHGSHLSHFHPVCDFKKVGR